MADESDVINLVIGGILLYAGVQMLKNRLPSGEATNPRVVNANLQTQMINWQSGRAQAGEDPFNWPAFRDHLRHLQAPDPGPTPLVEFLNPAAGALY